MLVRDRVNILRGVAYQCWGTLMGGWVGQSSIFPLLVLILGGILQQQLGWAELNWNKSQQEQGSTLMMLYPAPRFYPDLSCLDLPAAVYFWILFSWEREAGSW